MVSGPRFEAEKTSRIRSRRAKFSRMREEKNKKIWKERNKGMKTGRKNER
jgi:hypothetical protein